jgi:hypothetical protein
MRTRERAGDSFFRGAVAHYYGDTQRATPEKLARHDAIYGDSLDDEIIMLYEAHLDDLNHAHCACRS